MKCDEEDTTDGSLRDHRRAWLAVGDNGLGGVSGERLRRYGASWGRSAT